jgi:hypothetical protein
MRQTDINLNGAYASTRRSISKLTDPLSQDTLPISVILEELTADDSFTQDPLFVGAILEEVPADTPPTITSPTNPLTQDPLFVGDILEEVIVDTPSTITSPTDLLTLDISLIDIVREEITMDTPPTITNPIRPFDQYSPSIDAILQEIRAASSVSWGSNCETSFIRYLTRCQDIPKDPTRFFDIAEAIKLIGDRAAKAATFARNSELFQIKTDKVSECCSLLDPTLIPLDGMFACATLMSTLCTLHCSLIETMWSTFNLIDMLHPLEYETVGDLYGSNIPRDWHKLWDQGVCYYHIPFELFNLNYRVG